MPTHYLSYLCWGDAPIDILDIHINLGCTPLPSPRLLDRRSDLLKLHIYGYLNKISSEEIQVYANDLASIFDSTDAATVDSQSTSDVSETQLAA